MRIRIWTLAGIVLSALTAVLAAQMTVFAAAGPSFELRSGVIVDPARGAIYLMSPEPGINAIDIASGKLLWRTTSGAKPLLAFDDRLVAQAEASAGTRALPVVVLNTMARGTPVKWATVPLSPPAFASISDGMGTSFAADASVSSGELEVSWRFMQRGGLARPGLPPPEIKGAARIDLNTAKVQAMPASNSPLQRRASPTFGAPADIKLEPGFNFVMASADGQTILANKPAGTDATGWTDYFWAIYSLQSRERLAKIRMPTSAAPFFVWNSTLIYESRPYGRRINGNWIQEPLELRAIDLRTSREAWKTPIRDTSYRGPLPPRP